MKDHFSLLLHVKTGYRVARFQYKRTLMLNNKNTDTFYFNTKW